MTDEDINVSTIKTKTICAFIVYCVSGTFMTIVNKLAIVVFPYVNVLLLLQNGTTLVLLTLSIYFSHDTFGSMPPVKLADIKLWIPLALSFVLTLISRLFSLFYVSVSTVIVMHRLSTLSITLLEYTVFGTEINSLTMVTLVGMAFGATMYAKHDMTFNVLGYTWLCIDIVGATIYHVFSKKANCMPETKDIGPFGVLYYNNLISLPVLLILACISGELTKLQSYFDFATFLKIKSVGVVLLSCILPYLLTTTVLEVKTLISITFLMIPKNIIKFSTVVISEIFVQSTLDAIGFTAAIFVLFLGWLYSQATKPFAKPLFLFAVLLMVIFGSFFKYQHPHVGMVDAGLNFSVNSNNEEQMIVDRKKTKGDEIYQSFVPVPTLNRTTRRMLPGIWIKNTTDSQLPANCLNKNASVWKTCDAERCAPYNGTINLEYPRTTISGEKTGEFVNRVLEVAWGSNPPSVDLYLRSGCNGILEMKYLLESIELFWPRFLGSIVIILDAGDEVILQHLLPTNPTHHYIIGFEHLPCFPGRVFNQYSYLNLDRHCTADYVVTIDSDCVFHSPVTPDFIFRDHRVILASSRTFQHDMWGATVELMMDAGIYNGHYMVTQPVTFALSTVPLFREWFSKSKGTCYEDRLTQLPPQYYSTFCWMCQLGTYLERGNPLQSDYKQYWYHHLDDTSIEPLLRYAIHVTYELYTSGPCDASICYEKSVTEIIKEGLCRAFGPSIFHLCSNYSDVAYINEVTFLYAHTEIQPINEIARAKALADYLKRVSNATAIALGKDL